MEVFLHMSDKVSTVAMESLLREIGAVPKVEDKLSKIKDRCVVLSLGRINRWTSYILKRNKLTTVLIRDVKFTPNKYVAKAFILSIGQLVPPFSTRELQKMLRIMSYKHRLSKDKENAGS